MEIDPEETAAVQAHLKYDRKEARENLRSEIAGSMAHILGLIHKAREAELSFASNESVNVDDFDRIYELIVRTDREIGKVLK